MKHCPSWPQETERGGVTCPCFHLLIHPLRVFGALDVHPGGSVGKKPTCSTGDVGLIPGLGRFPGGGNSNPLVYSCHVQRSLAGCSPWGCKESGTTEQSSTHRCPQVLGSLQGAEQSKPSLVRRHSTWKVRKQSVGCWMEEIPPGGRASELEGARRAAGPVGEESWKEERAG